MPRVAFAASMPLGPIGAERHSHLLDFRRVPLRPGRQPGSHPSLTSIDIYVPEEFEKTREIVLFLHVHLGGLCSRYLLGVS